MRASTALLTLTLATPSVAYAQGRGIPVEDALLLVPASEVRCGDQAVTPLFADDLAPDVGQESVEPSSTVIDFSLDASGRPLNIRPASGPSAPPPVRIGRDTTGTQAALAAWRLPAGARDDCRLTVRYAPKPLAEAGTDDLLRYFAVTRTRGDVRDAVARRLGGPDADCRGAWGGRRAKTMSHPDFAIGNRPPPGGRSWTVVRWNVEADGRTSGVETLGSSGDAAFDAEARRAVSDSVVHPGPPVRGCVYNFNRRGPHLPAPAMPERRKDLLADCPAAVSDRFQPNRDLAYPRAFRDRGVEGWALVRFDFATWGAVGNVEVVEAQPAAAFGEAAKRAVYGGRATPGFDAGVRCVVPVHYRMPTGTAQEEAPQD